MRSSFFAALVFLIFGQFTGVPIAFASAAAAETSWGAQVAGSFSEPRAMAAYQELQKKYPAILAGQAPKIVRGIMAGGGTGSFYHVLVEAGTRAEAEDFCKRLEAAGGACVVEKMDLSSE